MVRLLVLQLLPELLPLLLHPGQLLAAPRAQAAQPLGQSLQPVPLQVHRLHLRLQLLGTAEVITCSQAPREDIKLSPAINERPDH